MEGGKKEGRKGGREGGREGGRKGRRKERNCTIMPKKYSYSTAALFLDSIIIISFLLILT